MKRYLRRECPYAIFWPNGVPVSSSELNDVVMWYWGESYEEAKQDIQSLSAEQLQNAVNYYAEKVL